METINLKQSVSQTFNLLKYTFGIIPIVAGLDKFTNLLSSWDKYIHPSIVEMLPVAPAAFMMVVGIIEMAAGVIVLLRPAIGGYIVAAWLTLIALTLLASGKYWDVAVRDLVMAVGAIALAKLSKVV